MLLVIGFTSCEDYLTEESPDQPTSDQIWVSYEAVEQYLATTYSYISTTGWTYHEYFYLPENFRSDDIHPESGTTDWGYLQRIVNFSNTASEGVPAYMWNRWYVGIKMANDIIENVPTMDMLSENEQNELIAEAKFLRAFYHFNLKRNFHDIILRVSVPKSPEELSQALATEDEVYTQIEEDFSFAAAHLPQSWASQYWGRATANAAFAFLGKAHLYQADWSEANKAFEQISGHALVRGTAYRSMFDGTAEVNEEVIFSRGYTEEQIDALDIYHQLGVAMAPQGYNGGWNMASISDYCASTFEDGDIRKAASILEHGQEFDGTIVDFPNPDFKMSLKYVESINAISTNRSVVDLILMRYADVLLMQAEALNEMGQDTQALTFLNQVRNRANLSSVSLTGDELRTEIRKQRMLELVSEGQRFYDLARWGITKQQLVASGNPYAEKFEDKHNYFPIPLEEAQRNKYVDPTPGF
ncbi:putative outer membrane starch-binding protein [Sediminitomix flava]|uniref:Putative outer membrane starch-binding protein n=2 Tax=Sediminitomix flava TaxID=379075 RepID=A0A315ZDC8_SEDFL|nr:putative outer membrane starch-binding protein [Sediminitomix flava]